jgi:hypothetical protein
MDGGGLTDVLTNLPPSERPTFPDGGTCPTAPFDDSDQSVVDACTMPIAVAVGNGLRRSISRDGVTWDHDVYTPKGTGDQNEWSHRDVVIARGLIVVIGDSGILVSADGGETFALTHAGAFHDAGGIYFQGAIWVVSNVGTMWTKDGTNWTEWLGTTVLPGTTLPALFGANAGVGTSGGTLFAVSNRNNTIRLFDGTTWTEHALGTAFNSVSATAYGAGKYVILGSACCDTSPGSGLRASSTDGINWTVVTNASPGSANYRFQDVMWTGTSFFASATQYDKRTYSSADGVMWDIHNANQGIGPVGYFEGAYLGSHDAFIVRSMDGVSFTMVHTGVGATNWGYTRIRTGRVLKH